MEFFEKAHVSKKPSKKENKSDEVVKKKQLKQMLQGYKRSDNELIRHSGNSDLDIVEAHRRFDDFESTLSISDIDLTNSENEGDTSLSTTPKTLGNRTTSSADVNLSNLSAMNTDTDENIDNINLEDSDDEESISECKQNNESLSDCIVSSEDLGTSEDDILFSSDLEEVSSEPGTDDTGSEVFDADGVLAAKILKELSKKQNILSLEGKKRKVEEEPKKNKSKKKERKDKPSNESVDDDDITMETLTINNSDDDDTSMSDRNSILNSMTTNESATFISITVRDMPTQKLSDILEDYKHPTIKQRQDTASILTCPDFGSETDADSLVPELGDDNTVEDLENELEEIDNNDINEEVLIDYAPNKHIASSNASIDMPSEPTETNTGMPLEETTTDQDNTILSESEREPSTEEEVVKPVKVYQGKNCHIFVLKHPAELYLNGKVKVKAIAGTVEVFGHTLKDEVELYAPNNNFAQCFKTIESPNNDHGVFRKLTSEGLSVRDAEEIVTTIREFDGIICMSKLNDLRMDFVEGNVFMDLFSKCNKSHGGLRQASADLDCSLVLKKPWRYFEENDSWDHAVSCGLEKNSRGIVCGGKGLGKSTFLRYYVNRLLAKGPVLVIDLDPGQAEFTVAGNVSATVVTTPLLGPNFTHLKTPDITLNIGMINTMDNANRYVNAVTQILAQCRSNPAYSSMPWIINTMGMCTQMGLKFILLTIIQARPTFLIQLDTHIIKKRFECHFTPKIVKNKYRDFKYDHFFRNVVLPNLDYTFILTQHPEGSDKHNTALSPRDLRYLNYLAYFGELMNIHKGVQILGIVPYD